LLKTSDRRKLIGNTSDKRKLIWNLLPKAKSDKRKPIGITPIHLLSKTPIKRKLIGNTSDKRKRLSKTKNISQTTNMRDHNHKWFPEKTMVVGLAKNFGWSIGWYIGSTIG